MISDKKQISLLFTNFLQKGPNEKQNYMLGEPDENLRRNNEFG